MNFIFCLTYPMWREGHIEMVKKYFESADEMAEFTTENIPASLECSYSVYKRIHEVPIVRIVS